MKKPHTFQDILSLWDTPTALSVDLGVPYVNAQLMRHRRSIGDSHWPRVIELMRQRGILITTDDLLQMKFRRKAERQSAPTDRVQA